MTAMIVNAQVAEKMIYMGCPTWLACPSTALAILQHVLPYAPLRQASDTTSKAYNIPSPEIKQRQAPSAPIAYKFKVALL